jgi:hypothetical protein
MILATIVSDVVEEGEWKLTGPAYSFFHWTGQGTHSQVRGHDDTCLRIFLGCRSTEGCEVASSGPHLVRP